MESPRAGVEGVPQPDPVRACSRQRCQPGADRGHRGRPQQRLGGPAPGGRPVPDAAGIGRTASAPRKNRGFLLQGLDGGFAPARCHASARTRSFRPPGSWVARSAARHPLQRPLIADRRPVPDRARRPSSKPVVHLSHEDRYSWHRRPRDHLHRRRAVRPRAVASDQHPGSPRTPPAGRHHRPPGRDRDPPTLSAARLLQPVRLRGARARLQRRCRRPASWRGAAVRRPAGGARAAARRLADAERRRGAAVGVRPAAAARVDRRHRVDRAVRGRGAGSGRG